MDFGKVEDLDEVDFTLPDDHPDTDKLLKKLKKKGEPEIYVGCAKWGRPEWKGKIYPKKAKAKDFLHYYLKQFNCIELNATFYGMPKPDDIKEWRKEAPEDFKFLPKFSQVITHFKRLKDADEVTKEFIKSIKNFKENLGTSFLQFHPNFSPKNLDILKTYLKKLPKGFDASVEFRHPEWFTTEAGNEGFKLLRELGFGTVITDAAGRRDVIHQRLTSPTAFIRFVGNSLHKTDYERIDEWVDRMCKWIKGGVERIYFIMHMHDEAYSPELCLYTIQKLNKKCKLNIKEPEFMDKQEEIF